MREFINLFLTVVLGSGAALAILRIFFDKQKEKRERQDAIKYLAVQLAFQFEGFAIQCAHTASDSTLAYQTENHLGRYIEDVPQPQTLPASESYRFFDADILNRVFEFSQRCQMAKRAAEFHLDIGDEDDFRKAAEETTIRIGFTSLQIARAIRNKYRLGNRQLAFDDWVIDDYFDRELVKIEERKVELEKRRREIRNPE